MRIRLTKLSDQRHALAVERDDGRCERVELETRSTLHHDLTHLAVEEALGTDDGFFGALAAGKTLAELAGEAGAAGPEYAGPRMQIERAVAMLQHLAKVDEEPATLQRRISAALAVQGASPPGWFTTELVGAVRERLRQLLGRWRATPYGETMELRWTGGEGEG